MRNKRGVAELKNARMQEFNGNDALYDVSGRKITSTDNAPKILMTNGRKAAFK